MFLLDAIHFQFHLAHTVFVGYVGIDLVDETLLSVYHPPFLPVVRNIGYLCNRCRTPDAEFLAVKQEIDKLLEEGIYISSRPDSDKFAILVAVGIAKRSGCPYRLFVSTRFEREVLAEATRPHSVVVVEFTKASDRV